MQNTLNIDSQIVFQKDLLTTWTEPSHLRVLPTLNILNNHLLGEADSYIVRKTKNQNQFWKMCKDEANWIHI